MTYDGTFGIRQATNLIEPLNAEQQIEMRKISHQMQDFRFQSVGMLPKSMDRYDSY